MTRSAALPPALLRLAGVIMLGALMMQLDMTMTNIATNTLLDEFDAPLSTVQWVGTGYLLAMAVVIPMAGWALERFGARAVWTASIAAFLVGSLLCAFAWSAGSLIAFRVVQGLGGGLIMPLAQAVMARAAGPERLGRVMALIGVPSLLGPVLGPVLGGLIVEDLDWRWIFLVNVPVCLVALAFARVMPDDRAAGGAEARLDLPGLALLSGACVALVYGLAEAGRSGGFTDTGVLVPLLAGAALVAGFAAHGLRAPDAALIDLRLFKRREFAASAAALFLASGVMFGAMGALPLYYQQARGEDALHTGLLMIPFGVGMAVALGVAGRLSDRLPPRWPALAGLALAAAGDLVYVGVGTSTSYTLLGAAQFCSGLGVGAVLVPVMTASMRGLAHREIPRASVAVRIFQQIGASFGGAVLLIVIQRQLADRAREAHGRLDSAGIASAYGATFWWAFAITVLAAVPVLLLPGRNGPASAPRDEPQTERVK